MQTSMVSQEHEFLVCSLKMIHNLPLTSYAHKIHHPNIPPPASRVLGRLPLHLPCPTLPLLCHSSFSPLCPGFRGTVVRDFVSNKEQFNKSVEEQFAALDLNSDGILSRRVLPKTFKSMRLIETHFEINLATLPEQLTELHNSIFEKFDVDGSGTVDKSEMKKMLENEWREDTRGEERDER